MTHNKSHSVESQEPPAPWSIDGMYDRIVSLEQVATRHEGRLNHHETSLADHAKEVGVLTKTQEALMLTLEKMQETLVLLNEVLANYNKAKSFLSVFGSLGDALIFLSKLAFAGAALYAAFRFGKLP